MRKIIIIGSLIAAGVALAPMANADVYLPGCPPARNHWYNPNCNPEVWWNPAWSPDVNEQGKWNPGGYTPCVTPGGCWKP